MRPEGSADENTAGICVSWVSVIGIPVGVRIIRRRGVVTPNPWQGYTDPNKHSCLGRRCCEGDSPEGQPCDKDCDEPFQPTGS